MKLDRRDLLAGLGLAGIAALPRPAEAQTSAPAPAAPEPAKPKPTLAQRLAAEAPKHQLAMDYDGRTWSGPGLDWLVKEGSDAQFFLLGEEHGLAQVPALVGQLLPALKPAGYTRLGLEVSPPAARALDKAAAAGPDGLKRYFAQVDKGPAFYTMKEEAGMLAAVRAAFPGKSPLLFGLDYEIILDRPFIAALKARAPTAARVPLAALEAASLASWAAYASTKDIGKIFCFSGDPALVEAVMAAWPDPDPASAEILETLHQSLIINGHQTAGRYFLSNDSRAQFNRANWARLWRAETAAGRQPRCFFKFGAGHMVRGRSMTEVFDIASIVAETAALMGGHSFHLAVVPLDGGRQAVLNPETVTYGEVPVETVAEMGLEPLASLVPPATSMLFDMRPLRRLMSASVTATADPRLTRVVHGYDAVLFVRGATPSGNL